MILRPQVFFFFFFWLYTTFWIDLFAIIIMQLLYAIKSIERCTVNLPK